MPSQYVIKNTHTFISKKTGDPKQMICYVNEMSFAMILGNLGGAKTFASKAIAKVFKDKYCRDTVNSKYEIVKLEKETV